MIGRMEAEIPNPKLLASTGARFSYSVADFRRGDKDTEDRKNDEEAVIQSPDDPEGAVTNYFKSMQWYKPQLAVFSKTSLISLFLISSSNNFPGHLTAPVSLRIAPTIQFAPSSLRQISSPRTPPHLP
jgi:hypothetical protein